MDETEIATGRCVVCRVYVERADLRKTLDGLLHCVACPPPARRVAPPPPVSRSDVVIDLRAMRPLSALTLPRGFKETAYVIAATITALMIAACASQT
jgi:hypothetical protein